MSDTFRKNYPSLSDDQQDHIFTCKDLASNLLVHFDKWIAPDERSERSRCMNIARTNLEQAVMWAVKGLATYEHK